MDRLTEKHWRNLDPWECCGQDNYCKRGCHEEGGCNKGCIVPKIYSRLAAYEDTNLEPEQVKKISTAENEGRLLILPTPEESGYDGLKTKYRVYKARNNEAVEGCFVLRPEKDTAARYALIAYAGHCKNEILSYDILHWIGRMIANKAFYNDKEEEQT